MIHPSGDFSAFHNNAIAPKGIYWALAVCLLGLAACAPTAGEKFIRDEAPGSGRDRVLRSLRSPPLTGGLISTSGMASTALSSGNLSVTSPLKALDPDGTPGARLFRQRLEDGTLVEGLLFPFEGAGPKPLLMASFGFLQDRWGSEAAKFVELYLSGDRLAADVLLLDHPTAGPFLANNGFLSIGAYDDARMWIEVAGRLREELAPSGIHLFGVSMSGQTVVHALIEDARLGLGLFQSAVAVSIAPDFKAAPGRQLARLPVPSGHTNPWKTGEEPESDHPVVDAVQNLGVRVLMAEQFLPHYAAAHHEKLHVEPEEIAEFLHRACVRRIDRLREKPPGTWNMRDIRLDDLDAYIASTRIAGVIGQVATPLVLVSAYDDPVVERGTFKEVANAAANNPWVLCYETEQGGHFGFDVAYGGAYLGKLLRLITDPELLRRWTSTPK